MLENTPLDELMSWYGEAEGGGSCSNDFGNSLVNRWRAAKQVHNTYNNNKMIILAPNIPIITLKKE
jgi:hypothetical protein